MVEVIEFIWLAVFSTITKYLKGSYISTADKKLQREFINVDFPQPVSPNTSSILAFCFYESLIWFWGYT